MFLQKISIFFSNYLKKYNITFLQLIFSFYYCSIDLKKHSEHSGLCPDTSSLLQCLFLILLVSNLLLIMGRSWSLRNPFRRQDVLAKIVCFRFKFQTWNGLRNVKITRGYSKNGLFQIWKILFQIWNFVFHRYFGSENINGFDPIFTIWSNFVLNKLLDAISRYVAKYLIRGCWNMFS